MRRRVFAQADEAERERDASTHRRDPEVHISASDQPNQKAAPTVRYMFPLRLEPVPRRRNGLNVFCACFRI